MLCVTQTFAQSRTITGTVTAKEDGLPIPGVSVTVPGTTVGTQTNADGKFSISVPSGATKLQFSFIGYGTLAVPIGAGDVVSPVLSSDLQQLNEVVVTALGISRERKTLGYAQTTVKNETINASSPIGLLTGLQGKVAGLNISNVSGSPGGTTKVILRGYSSISGDNQPLYIVDGVPFNNSRAGSDGNYDFGNSANDIDPNLIDNMSILKGSEATALYGNRGSNGVIIITTKRGKAGKPIVEVNTGTSLTNVAITYTPQKIFGQGWAQEFILSENGSWGPKLDGVVRPWGATGATLGNKQLLKPFSFLENNVSDAYDMGLELNNNVSVRGGNETSTYLMSYGNIYGDGVLPGKNDVYKRNNFTFNGGTKYKKFSSDVSLNYVNNVRNVIQTGQGDNQGSTFYESLLQIPVDIPIKDLRDYKNEFFNVDNYFTPFAENPYYSLYENGSRQTSNRFYGNINLKYEIASWFTLNFQQSADVTNRYGKQWLNKNAPSPGSWNSGVNVENAPRAADVGGVIETSFNTFEYDSKLQGLFTKNINEDFDINGVLGINYNDRGSRSLQTQVEDLAIPGFFQINNSLNKPQSFVTEIHRRILGFYGQATLGYKDYAFLTVTARNDVTSTLAPGKNSYFFPAANLALILTDALNIKSDILTFAKLRGGYGETGTDASEYFIYNTLTSTNIGLGFGNIAFPLTNTAGNAVAGYSISNQLNQLALKPERVKEYEIGGEFRFLKDRINLDVTYYHRTRSDQPLPAPISPSSGYTTAVLNLGKTQNQGIEIAFGITPVKSKLVTWDINYTFAKDKSLVIDIGELGKINRGSLYDANLIVKEGEPLGILEAPGPQFDPEGHIIVDSQGYP
ncbi:MAG: SusC/RagA family TonB-linked outer membrane protein, partial [Mucilaginibacter sp.]